MAVIVNPHVLESCAIADDVPGIVQIAHRLALDPARDHERIVWNPRDSGKNLHGFRRQGDRPGAGLGIGKAELACRHVHLVPEKIQDLALAAAGQQQAHGRHRVHRNSLAGLRLVEQPLGSSTPVCLR